MRAIGFLLLFALVLSSCAPSATPTAAVPEPTTTDVPMPDYTYSKAGKRPTETMVPGTYSIEYRVSGTARYGSVTYRNATGGTEQHSNIDWPWTYRCVGKKGMFLYMSAQNGTDKGTVVVELVVNGVVVKRAESSGAYVIATASGTL